MADLQSGIGPFLSVYLLAHGWKSGPIGTVMTLGGMIGMVMTTPAGALIDHTSHKRAWVIGPGFCTMLASALILVSQKTWVVTLSQVATAIAGSVIGPAVGGLTLGLVRQAGFNRQNGRNQIFNHIGNVVGVVLSGVLGWKYGLPAVFVLSAVFGLLSIVSVMLIPAKRIDDRAARGLEKKERVPVSGWHVLLKSKPLLLLATALAFFHLGNAAMLPLFGLAVVSTQHANPSLVVATTGGVAQAVMIGMSFIALAMATRGGYWWAILISFLALPLRGVVASTMMTYWGIYPVQILDGIGAGLQSVAIPALVVQILKGTGRVNVGQGAVMTVQSLGASLSPALGGWIAQRLGYAPAFLVLGFMATISILIWTLFAPVLKPACEIDGSIPSARRSAKIKK